MLSEIKNLFANFMWGKWLVIARVIKDKELYILYR